mmetsp:Transcript_13654/g.34333  ORF Transcript_13654/g.34333 Transcript_13654/m.34333 type:complete len:202 (+) Transcript_13654:299-904(+)
MGPKRSTTIYCKDGGIGCANVDCCRMEICPERRIQSRFHRGTKSSGLCERSIHSGIFRYVGVLSLHPGHSLSVLFITRLVGSKHRSCDTHKGPEGNGCFGAVVFFGSILLVNGSRCRYREKEIQLEQGTHFVLERGDASTGEHGSLGVYLFAVSSFFQYFCRGRAHEGRPRHLPPILWILPSRSNYFEQVSKRCHQDETSL